MPIYEYACRKCEHVFDVLQKMTDEPLKYCPECGEPALRKLVSAPVFRLKGSGWYETDFKTGSKRNVLDGDKGESKDAGGDKADKPDSVEKDKADKPDKAAKSAATDKPASASGKAADQGS